MYDYSLLISGQRMVLISVMLVWNTIESGVRDRANKI